MKQNQTSRFDVAEHLSTPEEMTAYLEAVIEDARQGSSLHSLNSHVL